MNVIACNVFLLFMSLRTVAVAKNCLDEARKELITKHGSQWKHRKISYQVRQIPALFWNFVAVVFD